MDKERLAYSICKKLRDKGYIAYYAGGYVRDLILNIPSDDIDIATDASPEIIQSLFDKTIPVGISFGIVVVVLENVSFEVATFRKDLHYSDGRRPEQIAFCYPKEDDLRRDFTINGMFYDPIEKKVYDYVNGEEDLQRKIIKAIGDPILRFTEDRLRMVRACRFAARFNFEIEKETKAAIGLKAEELFPAVSIERIYQEFQKMKKGHFKRALTLLFELHLMQQIFPQIKNYSIEEFESCLQAFDHMPEDCPTILYLLDLFPRIHHNELLELLDYLKVSNIKAKLALFCYQVKQTIHKDPSLTDWVRLYAHPDIELVLKVIAAPLSEAKRELFFSENSQRKKKLHHAIERKKNNTPIVTSKFLMDHGIMPSKQLGELLEKAEEIAIEENLENPELVLKRLHKLKLWGQ